ncbi:hypothetical protein [Cellulosilyticum sp. WCF-2]|uniref:hypothetical protein n=1 Tax=Cellulosilyticum sp. WCF-2 TaxID=2497860 RepID=UPI000F8C3AFC|nr:hypothetical protein [Cellulosilyticum sp. WCF-2]QEH67730.1 hypothetical protein EKH84_04685 [Cellulosilyticum sp. WCF-2]
MGTWGTGLYSNDLALDLKGTYMRLLKEGKTKEEVERLTIEQYEDTMECEDEDEDDETIDAWLVLADLEWKYGRLSERVKARALGYLETGKGLEAWEECSNTDYKKREQVLEQLREKLLSPMPAEKKIRVPKPYECEWKLGDVFAYQFTSDYSKKKGVENHYMVFRVIQLVRSKSDNSIQPVVQVYKWMGKELPGLDVIYKECLLPSTGIKHPEGYLKLKSIAYEWNIDISSKRQIKKGSLFYLGNSPAISVIPQQKRYTNEGGMFLYKWIEEYFIDRYLVWKEVENIPSHVDGQEHMKLNTYQWKLGDVFAYKFNTEYSKEKGLLNKYILFRVIELLWDKEKACINPVIEVYQWLGDELPSSEMIRQTPLLPMMPLEDPSKYVENQRLNYNMILDTMDEEDIKKYNLIYLGREEVIINCSKQIHKTIEDHLYEWRSIENVIVDRYLEWKDVDFITY